MKKKVLFTATVDSHILHFHVPYLKYFKENGYEVHVATNGKEKIPYCDVKHVVSFERNPFKFKNLIAIKQLKKIITDEKFAIIHTHTPMGSVVTRLAAKKSRKKYNTRVLYTAHGFHFYKGAPAINWIIFYPVEKYLSKFTDTLITINSEDYDLAKRKFSKRCKDIKYIHGIGVDYEKFKVRLDDDEKNDLRKDLALNSDDYVIIYAAELNKGKNQIMLIKAIKKLVEDGIKDIKVLLPGLDSLNGYYQKRVKKLDLENYIHFLGYRKDVEKLMNISNLAVSTSRREGLGIHLAEAMVSDIPCIATIDRGHKELITDNVNGYLINQEDYLELAKKIVFLKSNKKIGKKFVENSKKIVEDYLIENVIKEMKKIYEE